MDLKELFKTAPEGATHASPTSPALCWYKDVVEGKSFKFMNHYQSAWSDGNGTPNYPLVPRPVEVPAIKTLEERIKERATERLRIKVGGVQFKLIELVLDCAEQPSGIGDLTISQAIEKLCAAIIEKQAPHDYRKALDKALEELVDRIDYVPGMITPRS